MEAIDPAVLAEAWARGSCLGPRDIGALMLTSRAWRDALCSAGTAERLLYAHVQARLPWLQDLAAPSLGHRTFANLLVRSALRAEGVLAVLGAMSCAARRAHGAPFRPSMRPLVDGSLWTPAPPVPPAPRPPPAGGDPPGCKQASSYAFWVLATLHNVAKRLALAQQEGGRPRTDLRPWALMAVFRYAEHLLTNDPAAWPPAPMDDALRDTAAEVLRRRQQQQQHRRRRRREERELAGAAAGVAHRLERH